MNIFKRHVSEDKKQETKKESDIVNKKQQDTQNPDPHAHGGCCGSCGGNKEKAYENV